MIITMSKTNYDEIDITCPFALGETVYVLHNNKTYKGRVTRLSFYKDGNRVKSTLNVLTDNDFALTGEWGRNIFSSAGECKRFVK